MDSLDDPGTIDHTDMATAVMEGMDVGLDQDMATAVMEGMDVVSDQDMAMVGMVAMGMGDMGLVGDDYYVQV